MVLYLSKIDLPDNKNIRVEILKYYEKRFTL